MWTHANAMHKSRKTSMAESALVNFKGLSRHLPSAEDTPPQTLRKIPRQVSWLSGTARVFHTLTRMYEIPGLTICQPSRMLNIQWLRMAFARRLQLRGQPRLHAVKRSPDSLLFRLLDKSRKPCAVNITQGDGVVSTQKHNILINYQNKLLSC